MLGSHHSHTSQTTVKFDAGFILLKKSHWTQLGATTKTKYLFTNTQLLFITAES